MPEDYQTMTTTAIIQLLLLFRIISEGFGSLSVSQPAFKGKNASLTCYFQFTPVTIVKWFHDDIVEGICENTGRCYNVTNERYFFERHFDQSILRIRDSTYSIDQGKWSCEIDDKWKFSKEVVVYSLPSAFDFENPPPSGSRVPQTGILLEAKAVCVFPKGGDVKLQYMIEGDSVYNNFQRSGRQMETFYSDSDDYNCLQHEHIAISRINVERGDFQLDSTFRFLYKYNEVQNTTISKSTIALIFSDRPCDSNPCKNNGTCSNKSLKEYYCKCGPRYTGVDCAEKVDPCIYEPCKNGGTCHSNIKEFKWKCYCPVKYSGVTCEQQIDTSSASSTTKSISSVLIHVSSIWLLGFHVLYLGNNSKILVSIVMLICVLQQHCCLTQGGTIPLRIKSHPREGEKGILECEIYAITNTVDVQWTCNGRKILSCKIPPQSCESNFRYFANINRTLSRLTIHQASYGRDDGMWSCIVNNLTSTTRFYVYSPLRDFRYTTPIDSFVGKDGKELSASLECVYPPDFENLVLQYSIKGVHQFNNFTKRKIQIEFKKNATTSCKEHEYKLTARIRIRCEDFDNLNVNFKFVYSAFTGEKRSTQETVYIKFPGHLKCRDNENADACDQKHDTNKDFLNKNKTTRNKNTDSPQVPSDSYNSWKIACIACIVIIILFIIGLVVVVVTYLWKFHPGKKKNRWRSFSRIRVNVNKNTYHKYRS